MIRTSCTLAVVAFLAALPSGALATSDSADLRFHNMALGDYTSYGFLLNGNAISTPAGPLRMEIRNGSVQGEALRIWEDAAPVDTSPTANRLFDTFCIELAQHAGTDFAPYEMIPLADGPGSGAMGVDKAAELAWLWEAHRADATTATAGAAFQAAVWEIINENTGVYSLYGGDFAMTSGSAPRTLGQSWLEELSAADLASYTPTLTFTALHNPDYQDYVYAYQSEPPHMPEPASMAAVGCGLAGLAGYLRKRRLDRAQG